MLQDVPFLLALIFAIGSPGLTEKYFFKFNDVQQKHKGFLFLILIYPLLGYLLFLLLFWLFRNLLIKEFSIKSELFVQYMLFLLPLTFIMLYTNILDSYLKVNLRVTFLNFIKEIAIRILLCSLIAFTYFLGWNYTSGVWFFTCSYGFLLLVMIFYIWRERLLFLKPDMKHYSRADLKEMFTYVGYIIPGAIGSLVAHKIDTVMIAGSEGLKPLAVYSIAYFIAVVVEVPRRSISQITLPILSKAFTEDDKPKVQELYQKNSVNQYMAGILIFSMIWVSVDEVLNLIPNAEIYRAGKYVILFIGLARLVDMVTSINSEIIQLSKYFRFNIIAMLILAGLTIVTNLLLMPLYGIIGTAMAFFITVLLFNILKTLFIFMKMKYQPFSKELIPLTLFLIVALTYHYFFPGGNRPVIESFVLICIKSLVVLAVFLLMVRKFYISPEFNDLLTMVAKRSGLTSFIEKWKK